MAMKNEANVIYSCINISMVRNEKIIDGNRNISGE
jgi:hypothetical protein